MPIRLVAKVEFYEMLEELELEIGILEYRVICLKRNDHDVKKYYFLKLILEI